MTYCDFGLGVDRRLRLRLQQNLLLNRGDALSGGLLHLPLCAVGVDAVKQSRKPMYKKMTHFFVVKSKHLYSERDLQHSSPVQRSGLRRWGGGLLLSQKQRKRIGPLVHCQPL